VLVVGAARTGIAVSGALARRGAAVRLADRRAVERADLPALPPEVELRAEHDTGDLLAGVDLVVPSPGVGADHPVLRQALGRGVAVLSEIEVAARLLRCPVVAITGTNGKSTTTMLVGRMLTEGGLRVFVGGNLGRPLIEAVEDAWDVAVAEISSFQLEWVDGFRPAAAVWLNLSPDHLDRHGSLAAYTAAKARLFAAQGPDDVAILNRDDPVVWGHAGRVRAALVSIGGDGSGTVRGAFVDRGEIVWRDPRAGEMRFSLQRVGIHGRHNQENMMAAVAAAVVRGVTATAIQAALDRFEGLPHRCQLVAERGGVRYYDDSKATNVGAVVKCLDGFAGPVVLLAGGLDKGVPFDDLRSAVRDRVRLVVAYGVAAGRIAGALDGAVRVLTVERFADAFRAARAAAVGGDAVLLSPGCASFDQFTDYAERGRAFRALVTEEDAAGARTGGVREGGP
jgi:UDP-N-acetylmuramoylalanine--D-glutamate ligase